MNGNERIVGEWRSLGGARVSRGNDDANVVFAHVSDLHARYTPRHQVDYDNRTSGPALDYGEDDRVIERVGGLPNVELTVDPTAKRGRRLVEMHIDGEMVDPKRTCSVATFRRPGVDYTASEAYCETSMIPRGTLSPKERAIERARRRRTPTEPANNGHGHHASETK